MAIGSSLTVRRLTPEPAGDVPAAKVYAELFAEAAIPPQRPYCVVSMISSLDGHASRDGLSGGLATDRADREIFLSLRDQVDAVLAGTQTIASEGYRRLIPEPERRDARQARGLAAEPLAVVLSRSGVLKPNAGVPRPSTDVPRVGLLDDPDQRCAIYTGTEADPAAVLADLRTDHGIRTLLCEGGPRLNAALFSAGLVDELLLSVSPMLLSGDASPIVNGAAFTSPQPLELLSIHERLGNLFLRYRVAGTSEKLTVDG